MHKHSVHELSEHEGKSREGIVYRKSQGHYAVHLDGRVVDCSISNRLRKQLLYPIAAPTSIRPHVVAVKDIRQVDPVAIGDVVRFVDAGDGTGMITEVLPRKNKFVRRAAGLKSLEQVIVANVDQIVIVCAAAQPNPDWELLDRYLAGAEASEVPALICFTKMDLVDDAAFATQAHIYENIGYPVVLTSTTEGRGLQEFKDALRGRVSVFVGESGVGKTTLLNQVQPGLGLRAKEVSRYWNKGRHTTTHLEMFPLEMGGSVIDTPGMREFSFWEIDKSELDSLFREMQPYLGQCRFGADCSHVHEPGCAIQRAVQAGAIAERRYKSYLHMRGEA